MKAICTQARNRHKHKLPCIFLFNLILRCNLTIVTIVFKYLNDNLSSSVRYVGTYLCKYLHLFRWGNRFTERISDT